MTPQLYDPELEHSSCGVGFITRKDSVQTHEVLQLAHRALCEVPHRGGMSAEGVGDGGGVNIDLSTRFFSKLTGMELTPGSFGVANFFMPKDPEARPDAEALVEKVLAEFGLSLLLVRDVPTNPHTVRPTVAPHQLPIKQWVFQTPTEDTDQVVYEAMIAIEAEAFTNPRLHRMTPLSMSARTQVLKGRLTSGEVMTYFADLQDTDHEVHTLYFHTRFSTNTDPHCTMAQPFRLMAHNGEFNTDRKNRIAETALAAARGMTITRPHGQSDSCRFDQTLNWRVIGDGIDLVEAIVAMMPPAWENDPDLDDEVRAMLEYFSLREEKNDGPAALVFGNGEVVGARLDRLGLRPLRTVETAEYLCVMSEAGQFGFDPAAEIRRGRIEAGGMLYFDHRNQRSYRTDDALRELATKRDYRALLATAHSRVGNATGSSPVAAAEAYAGDLTPSQRYVVYCLNAESFRFMLDPMLATGAERVSAMGYGNAINALAEAEGGAARYFTQRFSQVTNPPLDSIREADGMTLRVALGRRPLLADDLGHQLVVQSPILTEAALASIENQDRVQVRRFDLLYDTSAGSAAGNAALMESAIENLANEVCDFASEIGGIAVLSDRDVSSNRAVLPLIFAVAAVNQRLTERGLRLRVSLIAETGQIPSPHHVATALGFGASAVVCLSVRLRAEEKHPGQADAAVAKFIKAAEKSLMKTMGRVGLCTAESYISGQFFEPAFLDVEDPVLAAWFPHLKAPVGGVKFADVASSYADWHARATTVSGESDIPLLGLYKERSDGAAHSYGTAATRGFVDLTEEPLALAGESSDSLRLLTLSSLDEAYGLDDDAYTYSGYGALSPAQIDAFRITPGYRAFSRNLNDERHRRPSALRDVLSLPGDVTRCVTPGEFAAEFAQFSAFGNHSIVIRGLRCQPIDDRRFSLRLSTERGANLMRFDSLASALRTRFGADVIDHDIKTTELIVTATGDAHEWLSLLQPAPAPIPLSDVQPASEITQTLASGAMSHGALVANAHEAVAHGTNMVGGKSNCGEGGEHLSRYGTIRGSRIKQFASARFGVWAGYLADPMLEELEIKIAQGAKPGEGGQLPAAKVTVDIAAARAGTPGVELVSPPPHHDTYSIEDLAQLIHDCKAARVKVVVKLVSSDGIGTIAVGVAKAGADVINVAGNTGGTGAASVTSLKYAGRVAEIGIAEVHQALCANGLRDKVVLRVSGAHQCAHDVLVSAMLGADSFEFGTSALMMLKCVMAKNCNLKCPAGLTTNPEAFDGDPRALAQYLLNIAHDVRELLAQAGLSSLREARGRTDLLQLINHPSMVGQLDARALLAHVPEQHIADPVYLEKDFTIDDDLLRHVKAALVERREKYIKLDAAYSLGNRDKTVGGQLAIDIERMLNHALNADQIPAALRDDRGRAFLAPGSVQVATTGSAGQSYGAFCNDGMALQHIGTCNDGVGKSASGGVITVRSPGGGSTEPGGNVLVGNFALFGATGGRMFVAGQAGDRFGVRNSGSTAVVEGVGDFCCEYMTGGSVLNLGDFGASLGNGMSGGFVYQYDPDGQLEHRVSADSLVLGPVAGDAVHEQAVQQMLKWHIEATGSELGQSLLDNWETVRAAFMVGTPRALLQYQDHTVVAANSTRSELIDELANFLSQHQVTRYRSQLRDGQPLFTGAAPGHGLDGSEQMYALINSYTVLRIAQQLAAARLGTDDIDSSQVHLTARTMILTEDFALLQRLVKHGRQALSGYSDDDLAVLVAAYRLDAYKQALYRRNVLSMDALGIYGWILRNNYRNRQAIGRLPGVEELFAAQASSELVPEVAS